MVAAERLGVVKAAEKGRFIRESIINLRVSTARKVCDLGEQAELPNSSSNTYHLHPWSLDR